MIDIILQQIAAYIASLLFYLADYVAKTVNNIANYVANVFNSVMTYIAQIVNGILHTLENFSGAILRVILNTVNEITAYFRGVVTVISNLVTQGVQFIANATGRFMVYIQEVMANVVNRVTKFIEGAFAAVRAMAESVTGAVHDLIERVAGMIRSVFDTVVEKVRGLFQTAAAGIQAIVDATVGSITALVNSTLEVIRVAIEGVIGDSSGTGESLTQRVSSFVTAIESVGEKLVGALSGLGPETIDNIVETWRTIAKTFEGLIDPESLDEAARALTDAASPGTLALQTRADAFRLWQRLVPKSATGRAIFLLIFGLGIVLNVYQGIASANAQIVLQEFGSEHPYSILSPSEVIESLRRGSVDRNEAVLILRRHGYSEGSAARLIDSASQRPAPGDIITMWLRNLIDDHDVAEALAVGGLDSVWSARMMALAQVVPPVQDLIVMAVREVFSPEVAARFGQFEDFPAALVEHAAKVGLSREWAERYWAAHWSLPSATQGFEMLQRSVITSDELNLLLRALDVMPFWRDKLTQIAFSPFTRVDIRRMHQLGILDEAGVTRAHKDLGYNDEKAALLTRFVVRLNSSKPAEDDAELGRLTRANVLAFFRDGLLDRGRAAGLLTGLGITPPAAEVYLLSVEHDEHVRERKAEVDLTIELATVGTITFDEAQGRLASLGLETIEQTKAVTALLRAQERKTKLPTREDAEKLLRVGAIVIDDYTDLLRRLGYSEKWVRAFTAALTKGEKRA